MQLAEPKAVRAFWVKVRVGVDTECWPWQGYCDPRGYGQVSREGVIWWTHRIAFFYQHGWFPVVVMHVCDFPPCCNPNHLRAGTLAENNADRDAKGRGRYLGARGENNFHAKLTAELVRQIRSRLAIGETGKSISRELGVHHSQIYRIISGKAWRSVD